MRIARSITPLTVSVAACLAVGGCERTPPDPGSAVDAPAQQRELPGAPNIVLIFTDDQAPGTLGFEGNVHARTPRLDRLAAEGAYFSRAYVPIPQCAPSRAAVLTGLPPHLNGVTSNIQPRLAPDLPTFSGLLKQRGYACGLVGKWHLGDELRPQCGFEDLWVTYRLPGVGRRVPKVSYDPTLYVDGNWIKHEGYLTDILTDYAIRFVEKHRDRPFLLWLNYKAPHPPYDPPPDTRFAYRPDFLPLPASMADDLSTKPSAQRNSRAHQLFERSTPAQIRELLGRYYAMISSIDHNVGRLADRLAELELDRSTLLIYMSDNGLMHGEHSMLTKGPAFYEELVRSPLIMYWPGRIAPGTRVDSLAGSMDIFPTLCNLAGAPVPDNLGGRDLWPLLTGDATHLHEALFFEYRAEMLTGQGVPMRGLVTQRYKYVRYLQGEEELYDLQADPHEMANLIGDAGHGEVADSLRRKLAEWRARTRDTPGG